MRFHTQFLLKQLMKQQQPLVLAAESIDSTLRGSPAKKDNNVAGDIKALDFSDFQAADEDFSNPLAFNQGIADMGPEAVLALLDADESGSLGKDEIQRAAGVLESSLATVLSAERLEEAFAKKDTDENGEISHEEFS